MSIFTGSAVAIITPFKNDYIDFEAFARLIDFQLENHTDAIVVCGTTGEASTMTKEEKESAINFVVERTNHRVPVIAGTGGNNTREVIENSKMAEKLGADALLIVTPYYNKTTQAGLIAHYNAIADSVNTPIIVYNVPSRTSVNLLPQTMKEIFKHKNIVAIKEASGRIGQVAELAALCPECDIYSGNDDQVVPIMSLGGRGVISTIANIIPNEMHNMCSAFLNGDVETARRIQLNIIPVFKAAFIEVSPMPIKAMMNLCGFDIGQPRLPLTVPTDSSIEFIKSTINSCELLKHLRK